MDEQGESRCIEDDQRCQTSNDGLQMDGNGCRMDRATTGTCRESK